MIKRRCWSSFSKVRMRVKTRSNISIFLRTVVVFLFATGFSSILFNGIPNNLQIAQLAFGAEEYTSYSALKVSAKGAEEFHIKTPKNLGGSVNLQVWDEDNCMVEFEGWARANTETKAKSFVELIDINLERKEELVELRLSTSHPAPWEGTNYGIKANLEIFIPEDFILEANTFSFDLKISGPLKEVDIENGYGKTRVRDVTESTRIMGPYNEVDVENIKGELMVNTTYNAIYAINVDTKGEKASFKTIHGKIDLEDVGGEIEAETIHGPIYATDVRLLGGVSEFKTVYSKIDLEFEEIQDCQLYVKNTYANINVRVPEDVSAHLILTVDRGGKIHTNGIPITPTVLKRTRLEGFAGDGESEIKLDVDGIGKILLEGR